MPKASARHGDGGLSLPADLAPDLIGGQAPGRRFGAVEVNEGQILDADAAETLRRASLH